MFRKGGKRKEVVCGFPVKAAQAVVMALEKALIERLSRRPFLKSDVVKR